MAANNTDKESRTTKTQKALAVFYLIESLVNEKPLTAKKAMLKAKFPEATAKSKCHTLYKHPIYLAFLKEKTDNAFSKKEAIEARFGRYANSNIIDYYDIKDITYTECAKDGTVTTYVRPGLVLKDLKELPRELTSCIESIKETKFVIEIKLVSKLGADENLCKINGYFVTKVEHDGSVNLVANASQELIMAMHELAKAEKLKQMNGANNRIKDYTSPN